MPSSFSNGGATWGELSEHSNGDNSMAQHLNSQEGQLPLSELTPLSGTSMTTQLMAWEEHEIMEDAHSGDEESWALIQGLITETDTSSPYFVDLADYTNEDGYAIPATPNPTIVNCYETTRDSSQIHNLLDSLSTEDSPPYMLGASDGVLNDNYATDDLTTMSKRYGVFPFIKKTEHMSFHNHQLSQLLGQRLAGHVPQLTDPTGMDRIADVQMTLTPSKNVTLVLDIDGTLIHSSMRDDGADFSFPMLHEGQEYTVYVKKRPYVDAFLKKVAEMFKVAVFTASLSPYADQLLDILDPENRLISRRYYRESCLHVGGSHFKDLTIIEPDLAKVAIIDNTPEVFQLQVNNGIPIKTWSNDPHDVALPELMPLLEALAVAEDVRPIIANKFGN